MTWPGWRPEAISAVLVVGAALAGCGSASGCEDFNPASAPVAVGETADVTVRIVDGGWADLDFAGAFWSGSSPIPLSADRDLETSGVATLVDGQVDGQGNVRSGIVEVDFGQLGRPVVFEGPIGCE
jgi:hypothetical protein